MIHCTLLSITVIQMFYGRFESHMYHSRAACMALFHSFSTQPHLIQQ